MKKTHQKQTELERLEKEFRDFFENIDIAREQSLKLSREVTRLSSRAIKKLHQQNYDEAQKLLEQATTLLISARQAVIKFPEVQYAGFLHNAEKELIEGLIFFKILKDNSIFIPDFDAFDRISFLHGLCEAMGELRRNILDRIRKDQVEDLENMLSLMDDVYYFVSCFDYPDVITRNLRRVLDVLRSTVEKTRADITLTLQQKSLEKKLQDK
ncbi:MAG: haloacid dehalogenase [Candidatus Omnitrophica bacterium]|nr:haloacid dehalogenase [Candidatus Omnitrophota bacterium]MCM8817293.1 haloacid dehalogenase [Candidatus Omnitrophota bacterium]